MGGFNIKHSTIQLARNLRKNPTDAERKLWQLLRSRQLNRLRFRRQVPLGPYILDFACFDPKIVIEVDGSQHAEKNAIKYDQDRTNWLASRGYRVLRFWNNEVLEETDGVAQAILNCIFPHPILPPKGEGV